MLPDTLQAGQRHGMGTMFHADGTKAYTSEWKQNMRVIPSVSTSPSCAEAVPTVPVVAEKLRDEDGSRRSTLAEESDTAERLIQMRVGFSSKETAFV